MLLCLRLRFRPIAQRAIVAASLGSFVVTATGVPVPQVQVAGKDRSRPFACMDRQCGCASAEQCWRGCCCFTNREKVAWAEKHGVAAPGFVVQAAKREEEAASCCAAKVAAKRKAACCGERGRGEHADDEASGGSRVRIGFVSAVQARKCQGQAELWLALGAITTPPVEVVPNRDRQLCGKAFVCVSELRGVSSSPETPPPRA